MLFESIAFVAALFVIAIAILGVLARVCWHTRPQDTGNAYFASRCSQTGNK